MESLKIFHCNLFFFKFIWLNQRGLNECDAMRLHETQEAVSAAICWGKQANVVKCARFCAPMSVQHLPSTFLCRGKPG